jgi:predicted metal-dependent hydrolase
LEETASKLVSLFLVSGIPGVGNVSEELCKFIKGLTLFLNWRKGIKLPVDGIDRVEAKTLLNKRLQQLAKNNGFSYNRVFIRNQKTRWGSCSSKNNISLNMKLVKLPGGLIDYVIMHELVHTHKKDHSKAFWAEMDKFVGNGKKMASKLKRYGIGLY